MLNLIVRWLIGLAIAVAIFALPNVYAIRTLLQLHRRWRVAIIAAAAIGNVFWLLLPFVLRTRGGGEFSRVVRATLAPPWFGWLIFAILYSIVAGLLTIAWLIAGQRKSFEEYASFKSAIVLICGAILGLVGFYQALVPLRVERVAIRVANLPHDLEGYRIALIGDQHVGLFTRRSRLAFISSTITAQKPDVVAIAGDLIDDDPYFVPKFMQGLSAIPLSTPVVAVLGNHEMYGEPRRVVASLTGTRVHLLVNRGTPLQKGKARIWIAGLSDPAARALDRSLLPDLSKALAGKQPDDFPIVLSHQPTAFALARRAHLPLTLCAHTHGGQCGIRPLRWTLAGLFLPYHIGLYRRGDSQLYVTTGAGYWVLPFRLGMSPEIVIVELHAAT